MKAVIIFFAIMPGLAAAVFAAPPAEAGKSIFDTRCAACHNVNKRLTGPALAGVEDRREMNWIIDFVRSSQSLIKAGDVAALALFEEYNKIPMPDHRDLSDEDIRNIMLYVKSATVEEAAGGAPFRMPGQSLRPSYVPLTMQSYGFFTTFFVSVVMLIAALLFLVSVKSAQREAPGASPAAQASPVSQASLVSPVSQASLASPASPAVGAREEDIQQL